MTAKTQITLLSLIFGAASFTFSASEAEPQPELLSLDKMEKVTSKPVQFPSPAAAMRCNESPDEPGRGSPHYHHLLEVFTTPDAAEAYVDPWGAFKPGAVILKQKLKEDGDGKTVELYTGMRKQAPGYFPGGGDWEYFTLDAAMKQTSSGKLAHCASCHEARKDKAFLFRHHELLAGYDQLTSGRVLLHSSHAIANGEKLQYEPQEKKNTLGFWVNPADWAAWKFSIHQPGTFDLEILQGCGKGCGGSEVEISVFPEKAPELSKKTLRFTVDETSGFQDFKKRSLGTVDLALPGSYKLELRVIKKAGAAVMDVRQISLLPKRK